jgi:hypothetical protein
MKTTISPKSDVDAKNAFKEELEKNEEYDKVEITSTPTDITAWKNDIKYYFEIKKTSKEKYFGAATLTEWRAAKENPHHFWFVVAIKKEGKWLFEKYSPSEFMDFCTIPPFKIFF